MDNSSEFEDKKPLIELSVRDIREKSNKRKNNCDRFQIICRVDGEGEIISQKWTKGKWNLESFKSLNSDRIHTFSGDRFNVKHAGSYTVYINDAAGNEAVETITIKRSKVIILFIPILAILAGGAVYIVIANMLNLPVPGRKLNSTGSAISGIYTGETQSEILADLKKNEVMITDNVASSINFSSGKKGSTGSWIVENIKTNKVIMQAGIYLNGKKIAESAAIKPGQYIKTITLSSYVPAGTYTVTAYINYYNTSTEEYISKAGYKVKLVVGNS